MSKAKHLAAQTVGCLAAQMAAMMAHWWVGTLGAMTVQRWVDWSDVRLELSLAEPMVG